MRFDTVDDYWELNSQVSGPVALLIAGLGPDDVARMREALGPMLEPFLGARRPRNPVARVGCARDLTSLLYRGPYASLPYLRSAQTLIGQITIQKTLATSGVEERDGDRDREDDRWDGAPQRAEAHDVRLELGREVGVVEVPAEQQHSRPPTSEIAAAYTTVPSVVSRSGRGSRSGTGGAPPSRARRG